jgi:prepilin-type N-terminal cleavage/methylation domain-containing protein
MSKKINENKGFTLIELMVAMVIIAILAAIVLMQMQGYAKDARSSKALGQISSAIPSLVSCWGNGGTVNAPGGTYTSGGSVNGMGNNPICNIGGTDISSYGLWPNFNKAGTDMANYYYGYTDVNPAGGWCIRFYSAWNRDDVAICCNSSMNGCQIIGASSAGGNCVPAYVP